MKETLIANAKGIDFYASMSVKPNAPTANDLGFVMPIPAKKRSRNRTRLDSKGRQLPDLEEVVLKAGLKYLKYHPKVAWVCRVNNVAFYEGSQLIKSTTQPGISDIIGILKYTGRFFAIETKMVGKGATGDQQDYIDMINKGGGLAFVADTLDQIIEQIDSA